MIGVGISPCLRAQGFSFSPLALFSAGEQGAWYDPSDWSTLYQDSAGTTPVTAVGQPVGLMLDKRLGLVRGVELAPTTYTGVANGLWVINASSITRNGNTTQDVFLTLGAVTSTTKTYEVAFSVADLSGDSFGLTVNGASTQISTNGVKRFVTTGGGAASLRFFAWAGTAGQVTITGISVRELPGNHATQPTAINRPVIQQDAFGKYYLAFNGTNSWMSTASIDFTATDKMTVVAGVRKLSDAAAGMLLELSASADANANAFYYAAPISANQYQLQNGLNGARTILKYGSYPAPITNVLSTQIDRSRAGAAAFSTRINAIVNAGTTTLEGVASTANFGNYPLYIGARAGSSLFFNGNLYSTVIRGALSDAAQITAAETYANSKTGAY